MRRGEGETEGGKVKVRGTEAGGGEAVVQVLRQAAPSPACTLTLLTGPTLSPQPSFKVSCLLVTRSTQKVTCEF